MKKIGLVIILVLVAVILSWATIFYYKYLKEPGEATKVEYPNFTPLR
jgi:hypothetical protein